MRKLSYRYQRTLAQSAEVRGVGFLTGAAVRLLFHPAPANTGIVFVRTDSEPAMSVPALIEHVTGTQRRTTLGRGAAQVSLVEHVLAALAGLRIDNCYVEVDAPEPPGLDGSSQRFLDALLGAGAILQAARRAVWSVDKPLMVAHGGATLTLYPGDPEHLKISYILDYGLESAIGRQAHTQRITPELFATELAGCRTFLLEAEAAEFRRQGLGPKTTTADLLVIGRHGPINNRFRHGNELVRHKILDILGDLALLGADLRGHLVAYRSGHPLNIELVRALSQGNPLVHQHAA